MYSGGLDYQASIPLRSPTDDVAARATFLRWVWYASRRAELHLDEADDDFATPERVADAMTIVASSLSQTWAQAMACAGRERSAMTQIADGAPRSSWGQSS